MLIPLTHPKSWEWPRAQEQKRLQSCKYYSSCKWSSLRGEGTPYTNSSWLWRLMPVSSLYTSCPLRFVNDHSHRSTGFCLQSHLNPHRERNQARYSNGTRDSHIWYIHQSSQESHDKEGILLWRSNFRALPLVAHPKHSDYSRLKSELLLSRRLVRRILHTRAGLISVLFPDWVGLNRWFSFLWAIFLPDLFFSDFLSSLPVWTPLNFGKQVRLR